MRFLTSFKYGAAFLCLGAVLAACTPQTHATSLHALKLYRENDVVLLQVEVARSREEMARGLMFREELPKNQGMLFVFPRPQQAVFWMRNTLIPLDMLFIREDGSIAHIHPNAVPHDETPIASPGDDIKAVLEIGGGESSGHGIKIGHRIETTLFSSDESGHGIETTKE